MAPRTQPPLSITTYTDGDFGFSRDGSVCPPTVTLSGGTHPFIDKNQMNILELSACEYLSLSTVGPDVLGSRVEWPRLESGLCDFLVI